MSLFHQDSLAQYMERAAWHETQTELMEEEFHQRTKLISDAHKIYANIAHRFVSLLETDTAAVLQSLDKSRKVPQYYNSDDHRRQIEEEEWNQPTVFVRRAARSTSPPLDVHASPSPGRHEHKLYLSATKLDQTDPRLLVAHALSPSRPVVHDDRGATSGTAALRQRDSVGRVGAVVEVALSHDYQSKRRDCAVRRLAQQVASQAAVVGNFQEREARRAEAFRRREATLLKRAMENESKNSAAATERGRLELRHFDATQPLRLKVEAKGEASRIALKTNLLREQATARAARQMEYETNQFVAHQEAAFEKKMALLHERALVTHRQCEHDCTKSKRMLNHVLVERNIKSGQYQRVFHQHMSEMLGSRKRQDYDNICSVVRSRFVEPTGMQVTWSSDASSADPEEDGGRGARSTPRKCFKKNSGSPLSESQYARLCGARESAVRGLSGLGLDTNSQHFFTETMASSVIRGTTHVGWR
jgi:hypothetical protein